MFSAFFSSTETAYSSASRIRLKSYADNGSKKAKKAFRISEQYDKALSTILVGNNIVNIVASALATLLFVGFFGEANGTVLSTVILTVIILVFGEVLPKNLAKENSEKMAMSSSGILFFLMIILTPVTFLLLKLNGLVTSLAARGKKKEPTVTEDELKYIVESIEDDPQRIKTIVLEERYSRIPVYRGSVDNIIGILHARDYLEALLKTDAPELEKLIQPAYFIYRSKKLSSILADFKYKRLHIAVVTDDYGGTLGIVTMEDLLEQLVGEIWDEDEVAESKYKRLSGNKFEISGDMHINDMLELIGKEPKYIESESKSVGGWVIEQIGDIPQNGDGFVYRELKVTVNEVEDNRINTITLEYLREN